MNLSKIFTLIGLALFVGLIAACSSPAPAAPPAVTVVQTQPTVAPTQPPVPTTAPTAAAAGTSAADPFTYCSTIGNLDAPDARWTGAKVPDAVLTGLIKAANISPSMPRDQLANSSFWRCMNGKVYACTVGANLPCQEKADTNKTPSAALNDFCKANPASAVIPAVVTGRATVYEWKCANGKPEVVKQLFNPDARGFLSDFWHEIAPTTAAPGSSIANPASTNCIQNGGKLEIRKDAKGGEVGYCVFADKSECEEWAFMRGECKPGAKPVLVTKADNGKTLQATVGNIIEISLEGAPGSTGYAWSLVSGNDKVLKPQFDPAKPLDQYQAGAAMPGAPGKFVYKFQAVGAGSAVLKFVHKQSWVQDDPKAETFSVTVNVK
jgi:putative hemolysin/predicted secreted protein